jgi:hypothetical protein
MSTPLQRAHEWWETLGQADRQRVWNARHSYLAGDLVESMANVGVPVAATAAGPVSVSDLPALPCRWPSNSSWNGCPRRPTVLVRAVSPSETSRAHQYDSAVWMQTGVFGPGYPAVCIQTAG